MSLQSDTACNGPVGSHAWHQPVRHTHDISSSRKGDIRPGSLHLLADASWPVPIACLRAVHFVASLASMSTRGSSSRQRSTFTSPLLAATCSGVNASAPERSRELTSMPSWHSSSFTASRSLFITAWCSSLIVAQPTPASELQVDLKKTETKTNMKILGYKSHKRHGLSGNSP